MQLQTTIETPYTIEETNLERQHLLAEILNPLSLKALANVSLPKNAKILDVGCGLGDTSLMLHNHFLQTSVTGVDADATLIEAATEEMKLFPGLHFICADALHLPFNDNSFDLVFCRYILHHIPDAFSAMKEMKRVCKRGGIVFAQEDDFSSFACYPESYAYPLFKEIVHKLFADPLFGRKLIHHFKALGLQNIEHDAQIVLGDHKSVLKKFFRMTAEAIRNAVLEKKLLTEKDFAEWIKELKKVEDDEQSIVLMFPTVAVWGLMTE